MNKYIFCLLLSMFSIGAFLASAQKNDSVYMGQYGPWKTEASQPGMRVSLVTCGPGYDEVYEVFGHTAIRVIDSAEHTDMVYNYGTFNGFEENFELKFMQGKLLYYLSVYPFKDFLPEYIERRRSVTEQVLVMTDSQKKAFVSYLDWNAEPENRAYKYDFFYDNCATRIRDLFPETMGKDFKFGKILPADSKVTFRDIINDYFYATKWERFGINILLGSRIDKVMTDKDIMFLPDYLLKGIEGATINYYPQFTKGMETVAPADRAPMSTNKIAEKPTILLPGGPAKPDNLSGPLVLTWSIAVLTIGGLTIKRLRVLGKIMSLSLLLITGLLGILILVMWFATNHQGCGNNFNILWCLPTNVIIAFGSMKRRSAYALVAMIFIFATILLHIFRIQQLIMVEFMPLLLALLYIYGTIYRNSKINAAAANA